MARVNTYLNFSRRCEEAFNFYKSVFGGDFTDGMQRFADMPPQEGAPPLAEADQRMVLHVGLPILGGHVLMGSDVPEAMGQVEIGNNVHLSLEPDTRAETKRLFEALSAGGAVEMELQDMFWGAYYGSCADKFGVRWMFNCTAKE